MPSVLFVSNGHGEDVIAVAILKELLDIASQRNSDMKVLALPIVGLGAAYSDFATLVGPLKNLPSGGFARQSARHLGMDVKGGLFNLFKAQINTLSSLRDDVDVAVCVGDVLPLFLVGHWLKRPSILVATAKSDYYTHGKPHHWRSEAWVMKRYSQKVYARDEATASSLKSMGVNAAWVGNVMMDCIGATGVPIKHDDAQTIIGVLPGSREEAYLNIEDIASVASHLGSLRTNGEDLILAVALAPQLDVERCVCACVGAGFDPTSFGGINVEDREQGLVAQVERPCGVQMRFFKGRFGDVIESSKVVVGLSGTGNEQAVGMGKPVVAFPGRGTQFTPKFAKDQTLLLGKAMVLVESGLEDVACQVMKLIGDPGLREVMGREGKLRMGPSGGAARIANDILAITSHSH